MPRGWPLPEQKIEPGQVWADNDWRSEGRTLRVDRVENRYVFCTILTDRHGAAVSTVGREVRLLAHRMRPTSTGYRLVAPAREARDGEARP